MQGLIARNRASEQPQSSGVVSMKIADKRSSSIRSTASTPNSSFFASLERHMQAAEDILQARDISIENPSPSLSHYLMPPAPQDSSELLNSTHGLRPLQSILEASGQSMHQTEPMQGVMEESTEEKLPEEPVSNKHSDDERMVSDCAISENEKCLPKSLCAYLPEECCEAFQRAGVKDNLYLWQVKLGKYDLFEVFISHSMKETACSEVKFGPKLKTGSKFKELDNTQWRKLEKCT